MTNQTVTDTITPGGMCGACDRKCSLSHCISVLLVTSGAMCSMPYCQQPPLNLLHSLMK